jgi:hypothetical protein
MPSTHYCWLPLLCMCLLQSDEVFRKVNKLLAGPFFLLGIHCAFYDPNILWEVKDISLVST